MTNALLRMRDLAVQASNGTYGTDDLAALNAAFQALLLEIDRVADTTEFEGNTLLAGFGAGVEVSFGIAVDYQGGGSNLNITLSGFRIDDFGGNAINPAADGSETAGMPIDFASVDIASTGAIVITSNV